VVLTVAKVERPILWNYSVRAYRDTELDVDFVIHGSPDIMFCGYWRHR
jgi:NADPH-dependent ferric siderophore reductase